MGAGDHAAASRLSGRGGLGRWYSDYPRHPLLVQMGPASVRAAIGRRHAAIAQRPELTTIEPARVRHVLARRYTTAVVPQMNVRVSDDLRARLRSVAAEHGVSQSHLIRAALDQALADDARAPDSLEGAARCSWGHPSPSAPALRFDRWLTGRTGLPHVLAERMIIRGKVRIDGVVCRDLRLACTVSELCDVTVDGEAV